MHKNLKFGLKYAYTGLQTGFVVVGAAVVVFFFKNTIFNTMHLDAAPS